MDCIHCNSAVDGGCISWRLYPNSKFWISKIARNRERDEEVNKKLVFMGWTVIRFWGKDIRKNVDKCVNVIEETIFEIKLERDEEIDFNDNLDL